MQVWILHGLCTRLSACLARCGARWFAWLLLMAVGMHLALEVRAQSAAPLAADEVIYGDGVAPVSYIDQGGYYNPSLDSVLRASYRTKSYGQEEGNLDLGAFKALPFDDSSMAFVDGQVTLSDDQGVGYNLGAGLRWLSDTPFTPDPMRITGVSLWSDLTGTSADNYFSQVGVSYESLGEIFDFRLNGYMPVSNRFQSGDFSPTGEVLPIGNSIVQGLEARFDTAFYATEAEVARRLGNREAWGFVGGYALNSGEDDALGGEIGLRGYAFPDLLVQIAVSHDDIFSTNVAFSMIWFVGRTRTDYCPTCTVVDRFREPVLRNDYVVINQTTISSGDALTNPDGTALRAWYVDSSVPPGAGDGTVENAFGTFAEAEAASAECDLIIVRSNSAFNGQSIVLQRKQRFLGEGEGEIHTINTAELGTIDLPESAPGARDGSKPIIANAPGAAITLDDNNEVANFMIDGGTDGIVAGANGSGDANIHDIMFEDQTGNAMSLTGTIRDDMADDDGDGATTEFIANFTIEDVTFDRIGGSDLIIDADTPLDFMDATNDLNETISINRFVTNDGDGVSMRLMNTHDGGTVTLNAYNYDGGATADGAIELDNFNATMDMGNSTLRNGTGFGLAVLNESSGTINVGDNNDFTSIDGSTLLVDGGAGDNYTADLNFNANIVNDTGRSIEIRGMGGGTVTLGLGVTASVMDTGQGMLVESNLDGDILLFSDLEFDTGANDAITIRNNATAATFDVAGEIDIQTTSGRGFFADAGGSIGATSGDNRISTQTGTAVEILNSTIASGAAGVNFESVNVTGAAPDGIVLENNTGSRITIGDTGNAVGDGGTIANVLGDGIRVDGSDNVAINGVIVQGAGDTGIELTNIMNGSSAVDVSINATQVTGSGGAGVRIVDNSNMATISVDSQSTIESNTGTALQIGDGNAGSGGNGTINVAADITNSIGRSIVVQRGSGDVALTGDVTDTGEGILLDRNTSGNIQLTGSYELDTAASDAVTLSGNQGATMTFSDLDIETTTGRGFVANDGGLSNGGVLNVTGNNNTVTTTTGTAVEISDLFIGNQSIRFENVNTNGATNGVVLEDLTIQTGDNASNAVQIGENGGAAGSGGSLNTTGDAIQIDNVANAEINNVTIDSSAGNGVSVNLPSTGGVTATPMSVAINGIDVNSAALQGLDVDGNDNDDFSLAVSDSTINGDVSVNVNGTGTFDLTIDNTQINTGNNDVGFELDLGSMVDSANVRIQNGTTVTTGNAVAFDFDADTVNAVNFLLDDSTFINNSASTTATIDTAGSLATSVLNATVTNNTFTNNGAGENLTITSGGMSTLNLNLKDNTATGGTDNLNLVEAGASTFRVKDLADVVTDNPDGTVTFTPNMAAFEEFGAGDVPTPP